MAAPAVPTARRLRRPGWRDTRLVVGLLLVLVSVVGGATLVASLDDSTPVYVAARPLLPGQEVMPQDLRVVPVRLADVGQGYLDASMPVAEGTFVLRAVGQGELVPAASVGSQRQARDKTVSVPVDPAAAATLGVGTVVDVWVSRRDPDGAGERYLEPELVLEQAVVAGVPADGQGLGMGVGRAAVQVVVPARDVAALISSVDQEARVTLVSAPRDTGGPG